MFDLAQAFSPASRATRPTRPRRRRRSPHLPRMARAHSRPRRVSRHGLKPGDHLVTLLQNRWEAATLHWACQSAGVIITPINWRAKADEIDFYIEDSARVRSFSRRSRAGCRMIEASRRR